MKKFLLIGLASVAAIVVVLLFAFGPGLLKLHRLQTYVAAAAEADEADGGPWPRLTDTCIGCHGVKGASQNQGYPSLAGQPASYVAAQLHNFASGQRANPTMRPLAMTLSEGEIKGLADYFARQSANENLPFKPDSGLRARGQQLVAAGGCAGCHGDQFMGQGQVPRLAGQGYDYILTQFDAFATGTRIEPTGTMKRISDGASPDERKAMATYLASFTPAKNQ